MPDIEYIKHLAELSRLSFNDKELSIMANAMDNIIALMNNVRSFEPSSEHQHSSFMCSNNLRDDDYTDSYTTEEILKNATNSKRNFFTVPSVISEDTK